MPRHIKTDHWVGIVDSNKLIGKICRNHRLGSQSNSKLIRNVARSLIGTDQNVVRSDRSRVVSNKNVVDSSSNRIGTDRNRIVDVGQYASQRIESERDGVGCIRELGAGTEPNCDVVTRGPNLG